MPLRVPSRRVWGVLLLLVALAVVLGGAGLRRLRSGPRTATGAIELAGLAGPVEIFRDSVGVPHVWATSEADLFFAQGWLHASDRLWQMTMFQRVARGTLSALLGERMLASDRFLRTIGMQRAAARSLAVL